MKARVRPFSVLVLTLAGPIVWAAHFFVIYGMEAVICARVAEPADVMRWISIAATAVAFGLLVAFLIRQYRVRSLDDAAPFLREISVWLAVISIGAVAGVGLSALRLPACVPPAG
jgi:hypothetical protein